MKGKTWNESRVYDDPITLRKVRQITTQGLYNITPTYHINTAFSSDGHDLIFASARDNKSWLGKCHLSTGDITCLIEPVDGYGTLNEFNLVEPNQPTTHGGKFGVSMCTVMGNRTRWAVFVDGISLRAVHIDTLEERVLIKDIGPRVHGAPSISPDDKTVVIPLNTAHPEVVAGQPKTKGYVEYFSKGGLFVEFVEVPLKGGEPRVVFKDKEGISSFHVQYCPNDADLLLIDRDVHLSQPHVPPQNSMSAGKEVSNRIWTLRMATGELVELPSVNKNRFQIHSTWTWDGEAVVYHGLADQGGWYIGVISKHGQVIREYYFDKAEHYGHVSAMVGRPAIILDGNISVDKLMWLYYDEAQPRLEIIAEHSAEWPVMTWQYSDVHPQCDPTGKWISFNAARRGQDGQARSDVYVVAV